MILWKCRHAVPYLKTHVGIVKVVYSMLPLTPLRICSPFSAYAPSIRADVLWTNKWTACGHVTPAIHRDKQDCTAPPCHDTSQLRFTSGCDREGGRAPASPRPAGIERVETEDNTSRHRSASEGDVRFAAPLGRRNGSRRPSARRSGRLSSLRVPIQPASSPVLSPDFCLHYITRASRYRRLRRPRRSQV